MKERVRSLREEAILDAASDLITSKGYAAMTLDDITEAVGISKPTLYLHFKSKEDIIDRVGTRCLKQSLEYVTSLDPERSATTRIEEFITWCVSTRFGENSLLFQDLVKHILPNRDESSEHYQCECQMIETICELFEEAQKEGGIRDDVPATLLCAMLLGFIKNWRIDEMLSNSKLDQKAISAYWMAILRVSC